MSSGLEDEVKKPHLLQMKARQMKSIKANIQSGVPPFSFSTIVCVSCVRRVSRLQTMRSRYFILSVMMYLTESVIISLTRSVSVTRSVSCIMFRRSVSVVTPCSAVLHPESAVASTAVSMTHESVIIRAASVLESDHALDKTNHKVFIVWMDSFCCTYSASLRHTACIISFYFAAVRRPSAYYLARCAQAVLHIVVSYQHECCTKSV